MKRTGLGMAMIPLMLLFLPAAVAHAGNVNGTVQRKKESKADKQNTDKQVVVVWIEGAEESRKPAPLLGMTMSGQQFVPDFLVLGRGQRLQLSNDDAVPHSVVLSASPGAINLKPHEKQEMQPDLFSHTGLFDLSCSIHISMQGRVFVVPTQYFAVTKVGGKFSIPNVPAGTYLLRVWDEPTGIMPQTVTVPQFGFVNSDVNLPAVRPLSEPQ